MTVVYVIQEKRNAPKESHVLYERLLRKEARIGDYIKQLEVKLDDKRQPSKRAVQRYTQTSLEVNVSRS